MKKLIVICMAVCLVLAFTACNPATNPTQAPSGDATQAPSGDATQAPTVEATEAPTATPEPPKDCDIPNPWNDDTYKIHIGADFSNASEITTILAGMNGTGDDGQPKYNDPLANDNSFINFADGQFEVLIDADPLVWVGVVVPGMEGSNANSIGLGMYIKNQTGTDYDFMPAILTSTTGSLNETAYTAASSAEYILVDMNGSQVVEETTENLHPYDATKVVHSYVVIPEDFEGYLVIPFEDTQEIWGTANLAADTAITGFGWMKNQTSMFDESIIIDNVFFYGPDVEENATELIPRA